jgi:acyl-CoA synthetase (NDP forming)
MLDRPSAAAPLRAMFEPETVAVLGASRSPTKFGHHLVKILCDHGFAGEVFPINPAADEVAGARCYPDLASLPRRIDLACIALPASEVLNAFRACVDHGVRGVVIVSSGFSEVGEEGRALERELTRMSRESGVPFIGPNCEGIISNTSALFAVIAGAMFEGAARRGGVSIVSQSGAYLGYAFHETARQGVGIAKAVSCGNEASVGLHDMLDMLAEDEDTNIVLLHLEGLREAGPFRESASRLAARKPLVINHIGRNPQSAVVAGTHTAVLAAPGKVVDAFYRQCGAVVTKDMQEMADAAVALSAIRPPRGRRVAIVSFSGGIRVEMVDLLVEAGFDIPAFSPRTEEILSRYIPAHGNVRNPIDMADGLLRDPRCAANSIAAADADEGVDVSIVLLTVTRNLEIARSLVEAVQAASKPVLVVCSSQAVSPDAVALLRENDIPVFASPRNVCNALSALERRREMTERRGWA